MGFGNTSCEQKETELTTHGWKWDDGSSMGSVSCICCMGCRDCNDHQSNSGHGKLNTSLSLLWQGDNGCHMMSITKYHELVNNPASSLKKGWNQSSKIVILDIKNTSTCSPTPSQSSWTNLNPSVSASTSGNNLLNPSSRSGVKFFTYSPWTSTNDSSGISTSVAFTSHRGNRRREGLPAIATPAIATPAALPASRRPCRGAGGARRHGTEGRAPETPRPTKATSMLEEQLRVFFHIATCSRWYREMTGQTTCLEKFIMSKACRIHSWSKVLSHRHLHFYRFRWDSRSHLWKKDQAENPKKTSPWLSWSYILSAQSRGWRVLS